jgi:hypothetical protein
MVVLKSVAAGIAATLVTALLSAFVFIIIPIVTS